MIFMKILGTEKQMINRRYMRDSVRRYLALLLAVVMLFALPGRLSCRQDVQV